MQYVQESWEATVAERDCALEFKRVLMTSNFNGDDDDLASQPLKDGLLDNMKAFREKLLNGQVFRKHPRDMNMLEMLRSFQKVEGVRPKNDQYSENPWRRYRNLQELKDAVKTAAGIDVNDHQCAPPLDEGMELMEAPEILPPGAEGDGDAAEEIPEVIPEEPEEPEMDADLDLIEQSGPTQSEISTLEAWSTITLAARKVIMSGDAHHSQTVALTKVLNIASRCRHQFQTGLLQKILSKKDDDDDDDDNDMEDGPSDNEMMAAGARAAMEKDDEEGEGEGEEDDDEEEDEKFPEIGQIWQLTRKDHYVMVVDPPKFGEKDYYHVDDDDDDDDYLDKNVRVTYFTRSKKTPELWILRDLTRWWLDIDNFLVRKYPHENKKGSRTFYIFEEESQVTFV